MLIAGGRGGVSQCTERERESNIITNILPGCACIILDKQATGLTSENDDRLHNWEI